VPLIIATDLQQSIVTAIRSLAHLARLFVSAVVRIIQSPHFSHHDINSNIGRGILSGIFSKGVIGYVASMHKWFSRKRGKKCILLTKARVHSLNVTSQSTLARMHYQSLNDVSHSQSSNKHIHIQTDLFVFRALPVSNTGADCAAWLPDTCQVGRLVRRPGGPPRQILNMWTCSCQ